MAEHISVTPEVLKWARERSGYSVDEVLKKKSFSKYGEWEKGKSDPTYVQLEHLSELFKVPVAVFFFPSPPKLPPIAKTFRTLPESEIESLPRNMLFMLRKGRAMQLNLNELTGGRNPARGLITRDLSFPTNTTVDEMASVVRDYLGVSIDEQKGWANLDTALAKWRSALHKVGIFVFKDAFRDDAYSGFCLYEDEFPIVYVNNSSAKTRQIFTYFHELAHLLFHTSGIDSLHDDFVNDLSSDSKLIEILCNEFSAEFLIPSSKVNRYFSEAGFTVASAERLASEFHVSREVIFRRFLDLGKISESKYKQAVKKWNEQRQKKGDGGNYYRTKLAYLPRDYVRLALSQYQQQRIDEYQLADFLDIKAKNIEKLEEYFFEKGAT